MDSDEIKRLTEEHLPRIYRAALVLTGNPWDADDLAQETLLVLARDANRFEGRSSFYTWLYGILLNLERRERRRFGMRKSKLKILWANDADSPRVTPAAETPLEVGEWKRSLWSFVARLPDGQRESLVLRFSEHLSYEEIATVLDCPLGTVKSRIFNGLSTLREWLQQEGSDLSQVPLHPLADVIHARPSQSTG